MRPICSAVATELFANRHPPIALYYALKELGFNPWHGYEIPTDPNRHFTLWTEAMNCNFLGKDRPYRREEFDRLLGDYDACLDLPACLFWKDLLEAYPDAKVILTYRDADSWLQSMQRTIFHFLQWRMWHIWRIVDYNETRPMLVMLETAFGIFCNNDYGESCRQAYLDHNALVKETIPKEQLLEFSLGQEWEPLCRFLDVPVPEIVYPHKNTTDNFRKVTEEERSKSLRRAITRVSYLALPILAAGMSLLYYTHIA